MSFLNRAILPNYLEQALAPFSWSGILSKELKDSVTLCVLCPPDAREAVTKDFLRAFNTIGFLDAQWKGELHSALTQFSREGFK